MVVAVGQPDRQSELYLSKLGWQDVHCDTVLMQVLQVASHGVHVLAIGSSMVVWLVGQEETQIPP